MCPRVPVSPCGGDRHSAVYISAPEEKRWGGGVGGLYCTWVEVNELLPCFHNLHECYTRGPRR